MVKWLRVTQKKSSADKESGMLVLYVVVGVGGEAHWRICPLSASNWILWGNPSARLEARAAYVTQSFGTNRKNTHVCRQVITTT